MDPKSIKIKLKTAREAIRSKDYQSALTECKSILEDAADNYNALVFMGVALEALAEGVQVVQAYRHATEVEPDQPLAWQGLCSFYEKNPSTENNKQLIGVYEKLLVLSESDESKGREIGLKLAQLLTQLEDYQQSVSVFRGIVGKMTLDDPVREEAIKGLVMAYTKLHVPITEEQIFQYYRDVLHQDSSKFDGIEELIKTYLQSVKQNSDVDFEKECRWLIDSHKAAAYPVECLIKILFDRHIVSLCHSEEAKNSSSILWYTAPLHRVSGELSELMDRLKTLDEENVSVQLLLAYSYIREKNFIEARVLLEKVLKSHPRLICAYVLVSIVYYCIHDSVTFERTSQKAVTMIEKDECVFLRLRSVHTVMSLMLCESLMLLKTDAGIKQAHTSLQQLLTESHDWRVSFMLAWWNLQHGDISTAQDLMKTHCVGHASDDLLLSFEGWYAYINKDWDMARDRLEKAVEINAASASHLQRLSLVYWGLCDVYSSMPALCLQTLIQAAKLDPFCAETFLYLGHFYKDIQKDTGKACRCYQKAYDIDRNNDEAGAALCDKLLELGKEETAYSIYLAATKQSTMGSAKWAWLRLGLYQVKHEDPTSAITALQSALRADPADNHVWECLGEAYLLRGSYTAALKAFTKAAQLDDTSVYALYQIASVNQTLHMYSDAILGYKAILEKEANYVPALKSLGQTLLRYAHSNLVQYFDGRALDNCQEAIQHLTKAAIIRPDLSCVWKLLGDACTLIHPLPSAKARLSIPLKLVQRGKIGMSNDVCEIGKLELLQLGARCYGRAIKILNDCGSLWNDIGVNFYHQSMMCSGQDRMSLLEKSVQSLKQAVIIEPGNDKHWTALGTVACSQGLEDYSLAQHCFIKSIQVNNNNVISWTHLGIIYLKTNNVQLAHESFKMAQGLDPSYVNCWIGQALIAESVDHEDAMDLFRHTNELGHHVEAALGYAHWVCLIVQDINKRNTELYRYCIKQMAAVSMASDALQRYLERVQTNATAYNMYGILLEEQSLYRPAVKAYKCALELLMADQTTSVERLQLIRRNLARAYQYIEDYHSALELYQCLGTGDLLFADLCGLALCLYKMGQLQDSAKVYDRALELSETDSSRSAVHAALGMIWYKQGNPNQAKSELFNCSQLSPPCRQGLLALCSLGILSRDDTLATVVLQEILKQSDTSPDSAVDVAMLMAAVCKLQGNTAGASRAVAKAIHLHPSSSQLWAVMATMMLSFATASGEMASVCARAAKCLSSLASEAVLRGVSLSQLSAGLHSKSSQHNALSVAQKALHLSPDKSENKLTLIAACHAEAIIRQACNGGVELMLTQLTYITALLKSVPCSLTPEVKKWLWELQILVLLHLHENEQATEALLELQSECEAGDTGLQCFLTVMSCFLQNGDNTAQVTDWLTKQPASIYLWQWLYKLYLSRDEFEKGDQTLRQALQYGHGLVPCQAKLVPLIHLALLAFKQYKSAVSPWSVVFEEASTEILKMDKSCTAVMIMVALQNMSDKSRLSKRYFMAILEQASSHTSLGYDVSIARQQLIKIVARTTQRCCGPWLLRLRSKVILPV